MPIVFVFTLTILNGIAVQSARVVLPLYALNLGANALTIGMLGAAFSVLPLLLSMPAGKIADRFGSRWLLMFGALSGGLSLLLPYFAANLTAIFIASAIVGLAFGIYNVSLQNLIGHLSTQDTRARNFSNYSLANSAANFAGPLIAGFTIDHAGYAMACLYIAVLSMVPSIMLLVRGNALPEGEKVESPAKGGIRTLLAEPGIKKVLAASGLLLTGQDLYRIYMPVYGHDIGLSATDIGIILAAFPAAAFFVRLILQYLVARFKEEKLLASSFYVTAVCLLLMPLFTSTLMLSVVSFILGLGMGCSQPIITILMFSNSPKGRSGEAMGLRMTVVHFTRLVGPVVFGAIGSVFGLLSMFWFNALMMSAGGWLSRPETANRAGRDD